MRVLDHLNTFIHTILIFILISPQLLKISSFTHFQIQKLTILNFPHNIMSQQGDVPDLDLADLKLILGRMHYYQVQVFEIAISINENIPSPFSLVEIGMKHES